MIVSIIPGENIWIDAVPLFALVSILAVILRSDALCSREGRAFYAEGPDPFYCKAGTIAHLIPAGIRIDHGRASAAVVSYADVERRSFIDPHVHDRGPAGLSVLNARVPFQVRGRKPGAVLSPVSIEGESGLR